MINPDIFIKIRRVVFVVLGLCLAASTAWADVIPLPVYYKDSFFNKEEFVFESKGFKEEPRLSKNKNYSSNQREERERLDQHGKYQMNTSFFKGLFDDSYYILTSPWRWNDSDWRTASFVAGAIGGLFLLDDNIQNVFEDNRSSTTDDLSDFFEPFGNAAYTLPALVGFYLYGHSEGKEKIERTALLATESFLVTSLFTTVLKVGIGRARPDKLNSSSSTFEGPFSSNVSFPSGHTSTVFAIATVVANEYDENPLVTPISYGIATMTGLSRINDNQHWISDVFAGAALGYFTAKTILKLRSKKKGRHFTIYPRADDKGGGLVLSSRF
jgi:membrane-associated phospholipid phosphatase